jgi:hypothetical protein
MEMIMTRIPRTLALIGLATVLACGDAVAPEDIAGTWEATSFVFTSVEDPSESIDVIDAGGSLRVTFDADGTYELSVTFGGSTDTDDGTYTIDGNDITLDNVDDPISGTIEVSGDTMTLNLTGAEFDFDEDGTDDPATIVIVLTRE